MDGVTKDKLSKTYIKLTETVIYSLKKSIRTSSSSLIRSMVSSLI